MNVYIQWHEISNSRLFLRIFCNRDPEYAVFHRQLWPKKHSLVVEQRMHFVALLDRQLGVILRINCLMFGLIEEYVAVRR